MSSETKAGALAAVDRIRSQYEAVCEQRDQALTERDMARRQLQETLQSEQQLRDAHRLTEHLNAGLREQLDAERRQVAIHVGVRTEAVERDWELQRLLADREAELARLVQTSHDREAALLDALTALARARE